MGINKIIVAGSSEKGALEYSYLKAIEELGIKAILFDYQTIQKKYIKGGRFGRTFHLFIPVEIWIRKMNRELILMVRKEKPDLILLFANVPIFIGTLACIKTIYPATRFVWIWPDTPMNLEKHNILNSSIIDLAAIYSREAVPVMKQIGFKNSFWIPLAGDPHMHSIAEQQYPAFINDISFVGTWRPEREKVLAALCEKFSQYKIEIYGRYWKRDCKNKNILECVKGEGLFENDMARFFNQSKININVIDDTNFPAANMRFFEIPTSGGLQLTSPCPEMESIFRHREEVLYFKDNTQLLAEVEWVLNNPIESNKIRQSSKELLFHAHTYKHRILSILEKLKI